MSASKLKNATTKKEFYLRDKFIGDSSGIALILVMFVVALASIIVVNLAYSTYIGARANSVVERSLSSEYLLKSALNLARALIAADKDINTDGPQDIWAKFSRGAPIPSDLLGLTEQNIKFELEIKPENSKLPLKRLFQNNSPSLPPDLVVQNIILRLFKDPQLNFDNDHELIRSGPFKGMEFNSSKMIGALIDYQDADTKSATAPYEQGIESDLKDNVKFPNKLITRLSELKFVPGFSASRMRRLQENVSLVETTGKININFAHNIIIKALSSDIGDKDIEQIDAYRDGEQGPFKSSDGMLQQILGASTYQAISSLVDYRSTVFQVIAKVDYGTKAYFVRAYLKRGASAGDLPVVESVEYF